MARRFNKFGLRRDLNFADLANPKNSLNNLLNGLVDVQGESFISEDLDVIRDIGATTMQNADFRKITGAALKVTDSTGQLSVYKPIVKFKNRIDVARFTIGEPNFYGGDGLTTRYYPSTQITSTASTADGIFTGDALTLYTDSTGTAVKKEVFWERGIFNFVSKINKLLPNSYGGVSWTGWFKPNVSGSWGFGISSTAYYTFEIDDGNGNFILIGRKSQKDNNLSFSYSNTNATYLTLSYASDISKVLIGDVIISSTIAQFADTSAAKYVGAVTVSKIDYANSRVYLSSPLTAPLTTGTVLTLRHRIGETTGTLDYNTINLEQYRAYKIRFRFWVPNSVEVPAGALKQFSITTTAPGSSGTYIDYKWLYNEDYNFSPAESDSAYGDFRRYYTKRLDSGGGTIGGSTYSTYQSVVTKGALNVSYTPPSILADVTPTAAKSAQLTVGVNSVPLSRTDGIDVGQYVFGTGITPGTRVKSVSINQGIFLTNNPTSTIYTTLTFIDHRGLIAYETNASMTNDDVRLTVSQNTFDAVNVGDIVVGTNLSGTYATIYYKYPGINQLYLTNKATSSASGQSYYFYQTKGLLNNTLTTFCNNVVSAPTAAASSAAVGSTTRNTLKLTYVDNITNGLVVQFGTRIPSGTTITGVNTSTKVVTLSNNITDDIPIGQLITFAPAGTTDNKEICFPPIDTSPPFTATTVGLTTTSARPSVNIAPLGGATSELKFVGLSADGVATPTALSLTGTAPTYSRTIRIKDILGVSYKILGTV